MAGRIPKKLVTMRDVARAAGVSQPTVSRALSGFSRVRKDTRAAVEAAVKSLGYVPQIAASSLRGARPPVIGVFSYFHNAWPTTQMLWGINRRLQGSRLHMLLYPYQGPGATNRRLAQALDQGVLGGLIAVGERVVSGRLLKIALDRGLPVVTVEFSLPGCHAVEVDGRVGGRLAGDLLAGRAHRYLVIGATDQGFRGNERIAGFREALRNSGVGEGRIREVRVASADLNQGIELGERLLPRKGRRTALFSAWGDLLAMGIQKAWRDRGLRAGPDYLMVGYDDLQFTMYSHPGLTTVRQPLEEMGVRAARLMAQAFRRPEAPPRRVLLLPSLVIRQTA